MREPDKSDGELVLDALLKTGALTAMQHEQAVRDVREKIAALYTNVPLG